MLKGAHDFFALVVTFLNANWQPKQMSIALFEATKITRQTMAMNLSNLFYSFGLRKKIIAFVKNEGTNLNVMISTLMFVVSMILWG
jgi:hypothetical protein